MQQKTFIHFILFCIFANVFYLTSNAKEKKHSIFNFHHFLTAQSSNTISSKKNHFSVAKKQNLFIDTIPEKTTLKEIQKQEWSIDSIGDKKVKDSTLKGDTIPNNKPDTLPYRLAKNAIQSVVRYTAKDSAVVDVPKKKVTLYGEEANTKYNDIDITAPQISFDQETGEIIANFKKDSTGKVISRSKFVNGDFSSESDYFRFNMKSGKGITQGTYTKQDQMYIYGETIKKIDNDVFYALRGRFTTCDLDTPHFAFISNKIKFISGKVAISGPVHPEFEGVPIPVYLPFGIYPLNQERHSGILPPNFTTNEQKGLGLEDFGYYKVISDYWDVILRGSIYSYGSWAASANPRYYKRYRYRGDLGFSVRADQFNFKGDPDFSKSRTFKLTWNHSADNKSRPGVTFSSNVQVSSSGYNSMVANNPQVNFQNQQSSSINYTKTWIDKPFMLTIAANESQNTNLKSFNTSLPSASFTINTIYPFRRKEFAGEMKWFENIGIGYNGAASNQFTFSDSTGNPGIFKQIGKNFQLGAQHRIPISLSLPSLGAFQISPSVSYEETWFYRKSTHYWDDAKDSLLTKIENGFYSTRRAAFGISMGTRLFGMLNMKNKNSAIQAIRQELRPSISANYQPDLNKNSYYFAPYDSTGKKIIYSHFESLYNPYSNYSPGTFGGLSFSLGGNLSMKVRDKNDTAGATKKISLIDQMNLSTGYNFLADSFPLQNISASASTNLFNKINLTSSANFNVYEVNEEGQRIEKLIWQRRPFSLGRLSNASISLSTQFAGGNPKTGTESGLRPGNNPFNPNYNQDLYDEDLAYMQNNPEEFADFSIPWSLNLSYSFSYNNQFVKNYGFRGIFTQNVTFGGTLNITPKWQLASNGSYDITNASLGMISFTLSRDLHCWQMSISGSPVGLYRYFSINISPKSPLLRDLKVNRTRYINNSL